MALSNIKVNDSSVRIDEGAFNISLFNAVDPNDPSTYSSLTDALSALPIYAQQGGMSVKYVDTSSGEYQEYRLNSSTYNTTVDNWQCMNVDKEPISVSHNLVESGGVYNELALGAVYDISAHNNNSTFESLSALLSDDNLGTLIPTSIRKGGMSIKFIQSSGNKYVQYRLTADEWSITESDWQGVDAEPTAGSDNLVKSGGVYKNIIKLLGNTFIGGFDVEKENEIIGHILGSTYVKTFYQPTARQYYDFTSSLFLEGKKVRLIQKTPLKPKTVYLQHNDTWTTIGTYTDTFDIIITLPYDVSKIRIGSSVSDSLDCCCYLLSDLEQSISVVKNLDGTTTLNIFKETITLADEAVTQAVKSLLGIEEKIKTLTASSSWAFTQSQYLTAGKKLKITISGNSSNVKVFGIRSDNTNKELGTLSTTNPVLYISFDEDFAKLNFYTAQSQTFTIEIFLVFSGTLLPAIAELSGTVTELSGTMTVLVNSNMAFYEESVSLTPSVSSSAQYNLTFPKNFNSGDLVSITLDKANSYEYYVIYTDNTFSRITDPSKLKPLNLTEGKTFKNFRIVTGAHEETLNFTINLTVLPAKCNELIKEAAESDNVKVNLLVIGDSYSAYGFRWISEFINQFNPGSSYISLGVESARIKDSYADRDTYPYTSRPNKNDNSGNHNTYACQIEKLKRLMLGQDLDQGETQIYTDPAQYPNVIIIQGGENDTVDSDAKEATYYSQFLKTVSDVYVKSNSGDAALGTCTIKTPLDEIDRTNFAGAYRYLIDNLSELFPNAQIFITSRSNMYYWSGTLNIENAWKMKNQQNKIATLAGVNFINWMEDGQISVINNSISGSGTQEDPYIWNSPSIDTSDMLHPNSRGGKKYGRLAAKIVKQKFINISE